MIYRTDYHTHTVYSDGHGAPGDYVSHAVKEGLSELGFSDHLTLTNEQLDWSIKPELLNRYVEEITELAGLSNELIIKIGLEVDYLPGREREMAKIIDSYPFDYVIGSVHFLGDETVDLGPEYYQTKNIDKLYKSYFEMVGRAASSGLFDFMAHIDLVRIFRFFPELEIEHLYRKLALILKESDVAIEINTNGMNKPLKEFYPDPKYLHVFQEEGVDVCVNSDTHFPSGVGQHFDEAYASLLRVGFNEMVTFEKRKKSIRIINE